ncbi:hypothetical protein F4778DRAFT_658510 [Xylariomycetidae sp. FL2044]|nr:hypothetical protein F4778DRAFT_658510 [Xylariomycetidae sp. FL2044]
MGSIAELTASLPSCALNCFVSAILNSTCAVSDQSCICGNEALNSAATACVTAECSVTESLNAANATYHYCGIEPRVDHSFVPVVIAFIVLSAVVVAMRCLARIFMDLPFGWDDWASFSAMLLCIGYTACVLKLGEGGLGTDIWAVPVNNITDLLRGFYTLEVIYVFTRFLIRISLILYYLRIFRGSDSERLIRWTLGVCVVINIPIALMIVFQCTPASYFWLRWDNSDPGGTCIDVKAGLWAGWVILLVYDFWIMGVPLPIVAKLQLSWRKKLLIFFMFGMGIILVVSSIYKLTLIDTFVRDVNPTYDGVPMATWVAIEINLGVICACMPSLPVLFQPLARRFGGTKTVTNSSYVNNGYVAPSQQYSHRSKTSHSAPSLGLPMYSNARDTQRIPAAVTRPFSNESSESEIWLPLHETVPGRSRVYHKSHMGQ